MSNEEDDYSIEIIAIGGDLAAYGISPKASEERVSWEAWSNIEYLQAIEDVLFFLPKEEASTIDRLREIRSDLIMNRLSQVFPSKWHFRTTWAHKERIVEAVNSVSRERH